MKSHETSKPPLIVIYEKAVLNEVYKVLRRCIGKCRRWGIKLPEKRILFDEHIFRCSDWYARTAQTDKGQYLISVNAILFVHFKDCVDEAMENILLHELAHTCAGCMNHGPKWKAVVNRMNEHGAKVNPKPYSKKETPGLY